MDKSTLLKQSKSNFNVAQRIKLSKAIDYATKKHIGQKRLSGEDYITHPLSVASILINWKLDIDSIIAAVLHDTVEDTEASLMEIENSFGKAVSFLVDGVTKVGTTRSGMRDIDSYLPKTRDNLSKLLIAVGQDARVLLIKLADRLHNLRTLGYQSEEKQQKIAKESLEIFARLADRLGMGSVRVEIEEISFSYIDPRRYQYLKKISKKRISKAHARFEDIKSEVSAELTKQKIKHTINGRIKSIYSLHKKLKKVDDNIDEVYDLLAIRIIVGNEANCYKTIGTIHRMYRPIMSKIKDYIASPKTNGYQSLHSTVKTKDNLIVEFQIRTKQMHEFAEKGLAASFHYNEQKQTKSYFRRKKSVALPQHLSWIKSLQETAELVSSGVDISELKIDLFGNRIFVHSPKGDIYELPEGAFPLDFAYAVHTDLGKHAQTFIVNGNIARFNHQLHSGDVVEVRTKSSATPKPDWLKYVKTSKARQKINVEIHK